MKWLKTISLIVIGLLLIWFGGVYLYNGSFSIENIFRNNVYQFTADNVEQISGIEKRGELLYTISDDSWVMVSFPQIYRISQITIDIAESTLDEVSQIYYSDTKEFYGDRYLEIALVNGKNVIEIEGGIIASRLRIDFSSRIGDEFNLKGIKIETVDMHRIDILVTLICASFFWVLFIIVFLNYKKIKKFLNTNSRAAEWTTLCEKVISLSISDFKGRFSGSYLGIFWGIIQPFSTILLFWFVFQVGFRSQPVENAPFIIWLAAGMIPWNYFYDSWYGGTSAFTGYSYIVKKVVFKVEMLPVIKVISSSILNIIFNIILIIICSIYGFFPGIHIIDMIYFSFCLGMLTLGLSFITSTLNVFMKDVGQFLGIALNFLMWMTPMMWMYTMIPEEYSWFYKLNPLHYIINGYRESIIENRWFFSEWKLMLWYWIVTTVCLLGGYRLMRKMKPHFADVL